MADLPQSIPLQGFGSSLQDLRNQGMAPVLMGDFPSTPSLSSPSNPLPVPDRPYAALPLLRRSPRCAPDRTLKRTRTPFPVWSAMARSSTATSGKKDRTELFGITMEDRDRDLARSLRKLREETEGLPGFRFFHDHDLRILDDAA